MTSLKMLLSSQLASHIQPKFPQFHMPCVYGSRATSRKECKIYMWCSAHFTAAHHLCGTRHKQKIYKRTLEKCYWNLSGTVAGSCNTSSPRFSEFQIRTINIKKTERTFHIRSTYMSCSTYSQFGSR